MKKIENIFLVILLLIELPIIWSSSTHRHVVKKKSYQLVIISLDGFRYDYFDLLPLKNLKNLASHGVHAKDGIKPVFVTKTFPSHWTIATGLYEESHGIIDNKFYDTNYNETFSFGGPEKWYTGEPIWITAKRQGKKVGVYHWPGSNISFKGYLPDVFYQYDETIPFIEKISTAIDWLTVAKFDLVLLYSNEPDFSGHKYGVGSQEVLKKLDEIDRDIGILIQGLKAAKTYTHTDIIVLSDHGMVNISKTEPFINVTQLIAANETSYLHVSGPIMMAETLPNVTDKVYQKLKSVTPKRFSVYKKDDIPERYHYRNNSRIKAILAVANETYLFTDRYNDTSKAKHGYDNDLPSMRPIFIAHGPSFKRNYTSKIFSIVNIYPLMCRLMHIHPAPSNGTFSSYGHILAKGSGFTIQSPSAFTFIFITLILNYFRG